MLYRFGIFSGRTFHIIQCIGPGCRFFSFVQSLLKLLNVAELLGLGQKVRSQGLSIIRSRDRMRLDDLVGLFRITKRLCKLRFQLPPSFDHFALGIYRGAQLIIIQAVLEGFASHNHFVVACSGPCLADKSLFT